MKKIRFYTRYQPNNIRSDLATTTETAKSLMTTEAAVNDDDWNSSVKDEWNRSINDGKRKHYNWKVQ